MSLEILPYSTPTGIRHYVPLEDYQRALDNLDKLENGNMAMREAIKEAHDTLQRFSLLVKNLFPPQTHEGPCGSESCCDYSCMEASHLTDKLDNINAPLAKLQPFLTQPK